MKFRIASALLALSLPLVAQAADAVKADAQPESMFYKAYYLEKGQRDFAGAMTLYEQFLAKAPEHKLAKEAATLQFRLLERTGKTKERDAFKEKYANLLGNIADAPARPADGGDAAGQGGRGQRGAGAGQRGQGGRRGGLFGLLRSETKLADMSEDEMKSLKEGLDGAGPMIDGLRERMGDEVADKLASGVDSVKKALDAGKMEDAQKAMDELKKNMPQMGGRRGGGGQGGGQGGGRGGNRGGGGNEGGGGGGGGGGR